MKSLDGLIARLATVADVQEIVRICAEGWRSTYAGVRSSDEIEDVIARFYTPERVASEVGSQGDGWGGYVVAERDGAVIVAGGGGLIEPAVGELFVLYADPAKRRQGGGRAVLTFIAEQQLQAGASEQWVSVEPGNELGLSFYRAMGFVERGTRPAFEGPGESLRLSRPLSG